MDPSASPESETGGSACPLRLSTQEDRRKRLSHTALFGGTFDPIHNAHIEIAKAAQAAFALNRIIFVPAANPPHKSHGPHAAYEDRVRMTELACEPHPQFEVSRIEEGTARSYSIDTIEKLKSAGITPLAFLIGADAFADIQTWHRWQDVIREVEFIVVDRPGAAYEIPPAARVFTLSGFTLPDSSSDVRTRLARGDLNVPVPERVLAYIQQNRLYRSQL